MSAADNGTSTVYSFTSDAHLLHSLLSLLYFWTLWYTNYQPFSYVNWSFANESLIFEFWNTHISILWRKNTTRLWLLDKLARDTEVKIFIELEFCAILILK